MRLKIPKFRYMAQDKNSSINVYTEKPEVVNKLSAWVNFRGAELNVFKGSINNPDFANTLIDLDEDDYEFERGILKRIAKHTTDEQVYGGA